MRAGIKINLISGAACYHSVVNLLSFRLLCTNIKIKIHGTNFACLFVWVCNLVSDQSFIYSSTDALVSYLKKTILKFTLKFILKQLRYVSVLQLHHQEGAHTLRTPMYFNGLF